MTYLKKLNSLMASELSYPSGSFLTFRKSLQNKKRLDLTSLYSYSIVSLYPIV